MVQPTPDFRKPAAAIVVMILALGASWWGGIIESSNEATKIAHNEAQINATNYTAQIAAQIAVSQKQSTEAFCARFNDSENLGLNQSWAAYQTESEAVKSGIEVEYHKRRAADALRAYKARKSKHLVACDGVPTRETIVLPRIKSTQ